MLLSSIGKCLGRTLRTLDLALDTGPVLIKRGWELVRLLTEGPKSGSTQCDLRLHARCRVHLLNSEENEVRSEVINHFRRNSSQQTYRIAEQLEARPVSLKNSGRNLI